MKDQTTTRGAWIEVDRRALKHNIDEIRRHIGDGISMMGVIKADGYGHGSVEVGNSLRECGVEEFAVATLCEGRRLRRKGFTETITILGVCRREFADTIAKYDLSPLIVDYDRAKVFSDAAVAQGKRLNCFIAVDTGMGRLGLDPRDPATKDEIRRISELEGIEVRGLLSHLSSADEEDSIYTGMQLELFHYLLSELGEEGIHFPEATLANSAATMVYPESWFNVIRPGIIMYGLYPSGKLEGKYLDLHPAMSVRAHITRLRKMPPGSSVSYSRKFITERESLIATVPVGYADGYPRRLSCMGSVLIHGQKAPIAGNVCMDQFMVDVTDIPDVKEGDIVTLMGRDGDHIITANDLAKTCGTINYEILCAFGNRLEKVYVG